MEWTPRIHGELCRLGTESTTKPDDPVMAEQDLVGVDARKKWRRATDVVGGDPAATSASRPMSAGRSLSPSSDRRGSSISRRAGPSPAGTGRRSMGNWQTSELVIEAVTMAVARREPGTDPHPPQRQGMSIHLDRSSRSPSLSSGLVAVLWIDGRLRRQRRHGDVLGHVKRELSWMRWSSTT